MTRIALAAVCVLLTLSQAHTSTQGGQPPQIATDITAAEVQAVLKAVAMGPGISSTSDCDVSQPLA